MTTQGKLKTELVTLTPALAASLLAKNDGNRPARERYVHNLAASIKRGEWALNGDAIRVSSSGVLLDGQHRCMAVIEAGMPIQTLLVTGLDQGVFTTIDRGRGRTTADAMAIRGDANSSALAAATRLLFIYQSCGVPRPTSPEHTPTTNQQLALLDATPALRVSATWAASSAWCRRHLTPSSAVFCHYLFTSASAEAAKTFFSGLESGVGLAAGSPILLLRNRLAESVASKERVEHIYRMALAFKAFKLHRDGAFVKTLRVRTEGDTPERDIFIL